VELGTAAAKVSQAPWADRVGDRGRLWTRNRRSTPPYRVRARYRTVAGGLPQPGKEHPGLGGVPSQCPEGTGPSEASTKC